MSPGYDNLVLLKEAYLDRRSFDFQSQSYYRPIEHSKFEKYENEKFRNHPYNGVISGSVINFPKSSVDQRCCRRKEAPRNGISWIYRPPPDVAPQEQDFAVDKLNGKSFRKEIIKKVNPFGNAYAKPNLPGSVAQLSLRKDHELIHALIGRNHDDYHPVTLVLRCRGWFYNRSIQCWYRPVTRPVFRDTDFDVVNVEYYEANHRGQLAGLKMVINFKWIHEQFK